MTGAGMDCGLTRLAQDGAHQQAGLLHLQTAEHVMMCGMNPALVALAVLMRS